MLDTHSFLIQFEINFIYTFSSEFLNILAQFYTTFVEYLFCLRQPVSYQDALNFVPISSFLFF